MYSWHWPDGGKVFADYSLVHPLYVASMVRAVNAPKLSWKQISQHGLQLAEALAHVHRTGIIHRDVKPGNLLIGIHTYLACVHTYEEIFKFMFSDTQLWACLGLSPAIMLQGKAIQWQNLPLKLARVSSICICFAMWTLRTWLEEKLTFLDSAMCRTCSLHPKLIRSPVADKNGDVHLSDFGISVFEGELRAEMKGGGDIRARHQPSGGFHKRHMVSSIDEIIRAWYACCTHQKVTAKCRAISVSVAVYLLPAHLGETRPTSSC